MSVSGGPTGGLQKDLDSSPGKAGEAGASPCSCLPAALGFPPALEPSLGARWRERRLAQALLAVDHTPPVVHHELIF